MATFDQLSDEQRAIVELVLQQGKSYEELAGMLGMPEGRVRERAREALVDLAPVSVEGVEEDWRGQLADYGLGQQDGPEATATRGHLRRSEAARGWTRSLLDSLEQLSPNGDLPAIPDPDRGARRAPRTAEASAASAGGGLGAGLDPVQRRRLMAGAGVIAVILLVVLVWPVGVLTGGGDDKGNGGSDSSNAASNTPVNTKRQGAAVIAQQQGKTKIQILVQATGLKPSTQTSAYQVWLYDSPDKRKSLGATATDTNGNLQVLGTLPDDYQSWKFIDVSAVTITGTGNNRSVKNGKSVLRGTLKLADKPVQTGTGKNKATVLAQIPLTPLPN